MSSLSTYYMYNLNVCRNVNLMNIDVFLIEKVFEVDSNQISNELVLL